MDYYFLPNIITEENCKKLIKRFELEGSLNEELEIIDYRCGRYDFENSALSAEMARRTRSSVMDAGLDLKIVGTRWYVSKYWPVTSHITEHVDGNVKIGDLTSNYTFLLYLNDNFEGGETVITEDDENPIVVKPKTGSILLIRQDIFHEAWPCYEGFKYILRGDIVLE